MYSNPLSDIWSLGVILIVLSTGRLPWAKAITSDPNFRIFIHDPDFLRKILPISKGANTIITRMLELLPEKRIPLSELRSAIIDLDTFFMSREEVTSSKADVQGAAEYIIRRGKKMPLLERDGGAKRRALPNLAMNRFRIQRVGGRGQMTDVNLRQNDPAKLGGACPPPPPPIIAPKPVRPTRTISVDITSLAIPDVFGTSSTDESSGPVTPETFPVKPNVEVSDLEDDLGMAALSSEIQRVKPRPLRVVNEIGYLVSV